MGCCSEAGGALKNDFEWKFWCPCFGKLQAIASDWTAWTEANVKKNSCYYQLFFAHYTLSFSQNKREYIWMLQVYYTNVCLFKLALVVRAFWERTDSGTSLPGSFPARGAVYTSRDSVQKVSFQKKKLKSSEDTTRKSDQGAMGVVSLWSHFTEKQLTGSHNHKKVWVALLRGTSL